MRHAEGRFAGAGGLELYYRSCLPETDPRAVVVLVHGVCEHCGRYANVVGRLVDDGHAVYAYDQRGHGDSPGPRVHIDRWSDYRDDLAACLGLVERRAPGHPLVLYGHSMGALVVLDYLLQRPRGVAGAIVSGVPLEPAGVASRSLVAVAKLLSGVLPRVSVDLGLDACALSRDPAVVEAYRADPLVTSRATLRWGAESLAAVRRIKEGMAGIDVPLLVLHGEADRLSLVEGARALSEGAGRSGAELRTYPGGYHEPHNDLGRDEVAGDVSDWLARLAPSPA